MGVKVKGDGDATMPQSLLDDLGMHVLGQHEARVSMPGIVQAHSWQPHTADMKAVLAYMVEGARATGLEFLEGLARLEVREVRQWDRPTTKDIMERHKRERPTVQEILDRDPGENLPPGALFPVDERWALVWEDVEENAETARRLQDSWRRFGDPTLRLVDSVPVSWESYVRHRDNMTPSFLDYLKDLSSDRS